MPCRYLKDNSILVNRQDNSKIILRCLEEVLCQLGKDMSKYYEKDIKITSIEAIFVTLLPTFKIFLSAKTSLKPTTKNNFTKSRKFSRTYLR